MSACVVCVVRKLEGTHIQWNAMSGRDSTGLVGISEHLHSVSAAWPADHQHRLGVVSEWEPGAAPPDRWCHKTNEVLP